MDVHVESCSVALGKSGTEGSLETESMSNANDDVEVTGICEWCEEGVVDDFFVELMAVCKRHLFK